MREMTAERVKCAHMRRGDLMRVSQRASREPAIRDVPLDRACYGHCPMQITRLPNQHQQSTGTVIARMEMFNWNSFVLLRYRISEFGCQIQVVEFSVCCDVASCYWFFLTTSPALRISLLYEQ